MRGSANQASKKMPDKRNIAVLSSLIVGMTLVSGLLLWLEPDSGAPRPGVTLSSVDHPGRTGSPEELLFQFQRAGSERPWRAIVIHDSRGHLGGLTDLDEAYRDAGRSDSGYHMVINNGSGDRDGRTTTSYRWHAQSAGAYLGKGRGADWYHEHAIGICLIGDTANRPATDEQLRELVWLVRRLQARYGIPAERVYLRVGQPTDAVSDTNPHFPLAWFDNSLLR
ncbi:MAG: peptidoglycan recognition family protein [Planctomycetota bacterium]